MMERILAQQAAEMVAKENELRKLEETLKQKEISNLAKD
jgi:hypothetical protein